MLFRSKRQRTGDIGLAHALREDNLHDVPFKNMPLGLDDSRLKSRLPHAGNGRLRGSRRFGGNIDHSLSKTYIKVNRLKEVFSEPKMIIYFFMYSLSVSKRDVLSGKVL